MTFNSPITLRNKTAYLSCPVRLYFLNTLRCFMCQRYGYGKNLVRVSLLIFVVQKSPTTIKIVEMPNIEPTVKVITKHNPVHDQIGSEKKKRDYDT